MCQKDNEAGVTLTLLKDISDEELKEAIPKLEKEHGITLLKKSILSEADRNWIINSIVEEAINNYITIKVKDFPSLVDEICRIFPSEKSNKEFYYISRDKYKCPTGKLYSRYKNKRFQFSKTHPESRNNNNSGSHNSRTDAQTHTSIGTKVDEAVAQSLKAILKRDCADWHDVCEKWEQTFHIRQKDLHQLSGADFVKAWPRLSHAQAPELINIDFKQIYPKKVHALVSKWDDFKRKVLPLYDRKIKNDVCKEKLSQEKSAIKEDAQDFLIFILLNAVLPPSARFENEQGKKTKKLTIADAKDSVLMRLACLNDYQRQIDKKVALHYSEGSTLQPFIIVHGSSDTDLEGFYVYFDENLFKFDSFLISIDTCFKIFNGYGLKYPKPCEQAWTVIQKFNYEIDTKFDKKSPDLTSNLNFLNSQD
ncbi:uncharacterized protein [Drosophila takahashii]|uniref:uncharacterized protein isoform X2 n=1 Tax=Drosophila takahashii TaxID=29030 RepID=UPI0038992FE7